ncbi:hypothetical protein M405DRAFT_803743 [Rhizopogon salebrosus TDB-379]|nr:hypothetical protein M405DRAFT_803743 [Rhizopogon salebrosus TDB-379]
MSTEARSPGKKDATSMTKSPENNKGKGKTKSDPAADEEEEAEEDFEEIDPSAIRSRRTRGVRVDYTSAEALEKAGMTKEDVEKDDDEEGMKH